MKKLPTLVTLLVLASWSPVRARASQCPGSGRSDLRPRRIKTCVLNDADKPVALGLISDILHAVGDEFAGKVEVVLEFSDARPFSGDVSAWPIDLGVALQRACPADAELRVLLTNRRMPGSELPPSGEASSPASELAGASHLYFGYAAIFNVEARHRVRDGSGNPAPVTALKHELGHLFALEHDSDTRSFMYTPSSRSKGEWTPEVVRQVEANRGRTWFPCAASALDAGNGPAFLCR